MTSLSVTPGPLNRTLPTNKVISFEFQVEPVLASAVAGSSPRHRARVQIKLNIRFFIVFPPLLRGRDCTGTHIVVAADSRQRAGAAAGSRRRRRRPCRSDRRPPDRHRGRRPRWPAQWASSAASRRAHPSRRGGLSKPAPRRHAGETGGCLSLSASCCFRAGNARREARMACRCKFK